MPAGAVSAMVLVEPGRHDGEHMLRPGLSARAGGVQAATPIAPCRVGRLASIVGTCRESSVVILVRGEELVPFVLASGTLVRPGCGGRLRRWGYARPRWVRTRDGGRRRERSARVRCLSYGRTRVLLPARCVPGRRCDAETIGVALLTAALGRQRRLAVPHQAVRPGRRSRPLAPVGTPLGEAVSALGAGRRPVGSARSRHSSFITVVQETSRVLLTRSHRPVRITVDPCGVSRRMNCSGRGHGLC